jgi:CRISPR system Cascade subunit CasE
MVRGTLTVVDAERFAMLLGRGIGRFRAFGFGMLLLSPSSSIVG